MPDKKQNALWRRYMALNGDPLHLPLMLGFFMNAETKATLGAVALACGVSWYMGAPDKQLAVMAFNGAAGFVMHQALDRFWLGPRRLARQFSNAARYCIDKFPTEHSMTTKPNERRSADGMRKDAALGMMLLAMVTPWLYADGFVDAANAARGPVEDLWKTGMMSSAFWLSWMVRDAATFVRFNNVMQQKWNIVFPPPKPQRKESWVDSILPRPQA